MRALLIVSLFQIVIANAALCAVSEAQKEKAIAYSGLHSLSGVGTNDIWMTDTLRDENGWFVVMFQLNSEEKRSVLRSRFFNWWSYGPLGGETWDKTYGAFDEEDKVDVNAMPKHLAKGYRIHIFENDMRRMYFLQPNEKGGQLYFYYLKW